jgi:hypothetical protein
MHTCIKAVCVCSVGEVKIVIVIIVSRLEPDLVDVMMWMRKEEDVYYRPSDCIHSFA